MNTAILIFAVVGIVGICALLLFYPPRRAVAPRRKVDIQRIAELEYELGLTDKPPLGRRVLPSRPGVFSPKCGLWNQHGHEHPNGYCPGGVIRPPKRSSQSREAIEAAGYQPIDVTELGDPEPRYIRGAKSR